jgi:hypothetical protein
LPSRSVPARSGHGSSSIADRLLSCPATLPSQLAKRIGGYVAEIRSAKEPLQLRTVLGFLREITLEVTGESDHPWDVVAGFIARLGQEAATLLPTLMDQDQVEKGAFLARR